MQTLAAKPIATERHPFDSPFANSGRSGQAAEHGGNLGCTNVSPLESYLSAMIPRTLMGYLGMEWVNFFGILVDG
jgi:hypothetical protein